MTRVIWAVSARNDLRSIDAWPTRETSPEYSIRTLATIRMRARFLENAPKGGRPHHDGTRVFRELETPYLIRYHITAGTVEVLRVDHEREDWSVQP